MNQILKFRGQRIDTKRWVYGDYFKTPLSDENSGTTSDKGWFFLTGETRHCIGQQGVAFVVDEKTVSQFTSRTDKNGEEIYYGDTINIAGYMDTPFTICFIEGAFKACHLNTELLIPDSNYCIKIGNMYGAREL